MLTSVVRQPVGQRHCLLEWRQCFGLYLLNVCLMERTRAGYDAGVLAVVVEAIRAGGHENNVSAKNVVSMFAEEDENMQMA